MKYMYNAFILRAVNFFGKKRVQSHIRLGHKGCDLVCNPLLGYTSLALLVEYPVYVTS